MKKKLIIPLLFLVLISYGAQAAYIKDNKATLINNDGNKKVVISNSRESSWLFKLGYHLMPNKLGATIYQTPALFETSLAAAISSSASTATLVSGKDRSGNNLSGNYCFTVDSGLNTAEYICGVATGTALTGLQRGIGADGVTTVASLQFSHRYGADIKITDFPVIQQFGRILNGTDTFPNVLKYDNSVATSSFNSSKQIVSKEYVDAAASATSYWILSGSDIYRASGNVGISSTLSNLPAKLKIVSNSLYNSLNQFNINSSDTATPDTILSLGVDATNHIAFVQGSTYNAYNKNIALQPNGASVGIGMTNPTRTLDVTGTANISGAVGIQGLTTFGVIPVIPTTAPTTAGQVIALDSGIKIPALDGSQLTGLSTNWANGVFTKDISDSSTTLTITHGLGRTPKEIQISCVMGTGASSYQNISSKGSYNGSTYANIFEYMDGGNQQAAGNGTSTIVTLYKTSGSYTDKQTATISSITSSNFVISWTKASSPTGTAYCTWEAN